ncbi:MAG: integrase core domain-containing protein, partial [Candidatus Thiodiazotropha sp. (ex Lucinoma aequizonata)]|nr:integrase core domain-containing protein [Candidatus Thiodiazotropha sp. (ex Lucinoma aequizonata)]
QQAARALLHHDYRNDSTASRMRSLYVLHLSLSVAIPAIQPRLRLPETNRLHSSFHGDQRMKYTPAFLSKPFESLGAARDWIYDFVHWYNEEHRHSGIQFVTPSQRHSGEEQSILVNREAVYNTAKQRNPERWSRGMRNWTPIGEVWLNPENQNVEEAGIRDEAA